MLQIARVWARRFRRAFRRDRELGREEVARLYLQGQGLEIGALHNPLAVPRKAKVRYVDRMSVADLCRHYAELDPRHLVDVAIVDDGERLATVAADSQDFVIANHFLEHCQDPLGTLGNFLRVLRAGGVLYLAVPDKRFTFDRDRPVTPLDHLVADHQAGPQRSRRHHVEEWVRLVEKVTDPKQAAERVRLVLSFDYSIHYHVWTQAEFLELLAAVQKALPVEIELFLKRDHEMIAILRKNVREELAHSAAA
jgi:predicted SAM-dependent methyltransferase